MDDDDNDCFDLFSEKFNHGDVKTNPGHVIAARSGGKYPPNTSIKVLVHHAHSDEPITFTSDGEFNPNTLTTLFNLGKTDSYQ